MSLASGKSLQWLFGFFELPNRRRARANRRHLSSAKLDFATLEPRQLLATVTLNQDTGLLFIAGGAGIDGAVASEPNSNQVNVRLNGTDYRFTRSDVEIIRFEGGAGDDVFINETSIRSIAFGGRGNDILMGGSSNDNLKGGPGDDRLNGMGASDWLYGEEGDDFIRGGDVADRLYGGPGQNELYGEQGNDTIVGGDQVDIIAGSYGFDMIDGAGGNDEIHGDYGNDIIHGGDGNDVIYGGRHQDFIDGGNGDDRIYGESGWDQLLGGLGNDLLIGGNHDDQIDGGDGNDVIRGGNGNDILNGERGDDRIEGGSGDDNISGEYGIDRMSGDAGNDRLVGGQDNDFVYGNSGNDELLGSNGSDVLVGGSGNDRLFGGSGNDQVRGGTGNDFLSGDSGNDVLRGENGRDRIFGGPGTDSLYGGPAGDGLFGGIGGNDILRGEGGSDRFLKWRGDVAADLGNADAAVEFRSETANWTNNEIEVIDRAFERLQVRTGNARFLRDSLDTDPVLYEKWESLGNGYVAYNNLRTTTRTDSNGRRTTTYDRTLRFTDWNESNDGLNEQAVLIAIHELAHSWDSQLEITNVFPGEHGLWNSFLYQSRWRETNPNSGNFTRSGDGEWWYRNDSEFLRDYSRQNPHEDWATIWRAIFDEDSRPAHQRLAEKIAVVDRLFNRL